MSTLAWIYDLNGVLVNTQKFQFEGWQWLAEELGYKLTEKQFLKIKDLPKREAMERLLKWSYSRISEADKQNYLTEINKRYLQDIDGLSSDDLFEGFRENNTSIREKGIKVALISTGINLIRIIDRLDLVLDFDAIVDAGMLGETNYQTLLSNAIDKLQIDASQAVFISNSAEGVAAAHALKIKPIAYGRDTLSNVEIQIADWNNGISEIAEGINA